MTDQPSRRKVFRRPQLVPFLVTGALVGVIIGAVVDYLGPDAPRASAGQEFIAVVGPLGLLGGLLGAIAYLLVERFSGRA